MFKPSNPSNQKVSKNNCMLFHQLRQSIKLISICMWWYANGSQLAIRLSQVEHLNHRVESNHDYWHLNLKLILQSVIKPINYNIWLVTTNQKRKQSKIINFQINVVLVEHPGTQRNINYIQEFKEEIVEKSYK